MIIHLGLVHFADFFFHLGLLRFFLIIMVVHVKMLIHAIITFLIDITYGFIYM